MLGGDLLQNRLKQKKTKSLFVFYLDALPRQHAQQEVHQHVADLRKTVIFLFIKMEFLLQFPVRPHVVLLVKVQLTVRPPGRRAGSAPRRCAR